MFTSAAELHEKATKVDTKKAKYVCVQTIETVLQAAADKGMYDALICFKAHKPSGEDDVLVTDHNCATIRGIPYREQLNIVTYLKQALEHAGYKVYVVDSRELPYYNEEQFIYIKIFF
jgi:hypothetical protein